MAFDPDVKRRLEEAVAGTKRRIVFWENDASEFAATIDELEFDSGNAFALESSLPEMRRVKQLQINASITGASVMQIPRFQHVDHLAFRKEA